MAMEKVYEELEEVKIENEKLRADFKSKAELCEHLKKVQNEQVTKIREVSSKIEKQAQQLLEKEEEILVVKQANEDLKCSLNEKESIFKHLKAANDKLRAERDQKNKKWEEENRRLVLALDEANEKNIDKEQEINVLKAEIEGLKAHLSVSQKKYSEAEKKAKNLKELRERDDLLVKGEEDRRKVEDQLKWKKEQFKHLEEAHEKLRDQFKVSKKEWEQEKCTLLDEISLLQTRLDSQIRITGDLQNRLQLCNQALAHEETRRKYLEVEISEFKTRYENIFSECQDAKAQLDCLNSQRDDEVATLRHLLGTKESFYKEMEYRAGKLERENQELLMSLKELQEARIQEAGSSSSLSKLKNKLKIVEQKHKECSANLKAKEAEWNSQLEEMTRKLNDYSSQLESKDAALKVLEMELEGHISSAFQLKLQNEEISVMSLLLKSGLSEAQLKLANVEAELSIHEKEKLENLSLLRQQLELKNTALANAQRDTAEEREKTAILSRRVDTLDQLEEKHQLMEKELNRCKEMLEESSRCQQRLKEQALQVENESNEKIREVCDALDAVNSELAEEREKVASLLRRVEPLDLIEGQRLLMQKELERYKERIEEASRCQLHLEEQALQMESESREKLREVFDALETAKSELTEERERSASLMKRVESLDQIEEQWLQTQKELERYKERLEEASRCQIHLEEQALQIERESREKLREVFDASETAKSELTEEQEKTASLMRRVESLDQIEEQRLQMQEELERYKEMLEEASRKQNQLEVQAVHMKNELEEKLREVCGALETANSELAEERERKASLMKRIESTNQLEEQWALREKELDRYKELREVFDALQTAKSELTEEREKTASLMRRVESLDQIEEQWLQMQEELERYKKMLEEAFRKQNQLEVQAVHMKNELEEKLQEVCGALETANAELAEEHERKASLMKRIESTDKLEEQCALREKELDRYKETLEESSRCQLQLEERISQMNSESERKMTEVHNALEKANAELVEKTSEGHEIEFELWIWKSIAERLKVDLEESQELRKELEASLLAQVEVAETIKEEKDDLVRITKERDRRILTLHQQIVSLEQGLKARELEAVSSAEESIRQITREHDKILEDLQKEIGLLEEESLRRELEGAAFAHIGAERKFEHEKDNLLQLVKEKDLRIDGLMQVVRSTEEDFNSSLNSFSSELGEKQAQINLVHEAWEKIARAEILAKLEIEEKKLMIVELEDDIHNIQEKLLSQEKSLSDSKQLALTVEAELEAKHLEMKNLTDQMEARLRTSEALVDELKSEKIYLLENIMKLSTERENLFGFIGDLVDRMSELSSEDAQLMGILGRIVQSFDNNTSDMKGIDELFDSLKENRNCFLSSPATRKPDSVIEERSPFRQLN